MKCTSLIVTCLLVNGFVTQVTITVRMRQAGNYTYTTSNDRVTNPPQGLITAYNDISSLNIKSKFNILFNIIR